MFVSYAKGVRNLISRSEIQDSGLRTACVLCFVSCVFYFALCPVAEPSSSIRGAFSFSGFSTGVGTRAMGMNGAFAAISDDSSSAYWNPAGLTSAWYKELSFTRADLHDLDLITNQSFNVSAPETATGAMAFGWTRLEYDFESWREDVFLVSYAKTLIGQEGAHAGTAPLRHSDFNLSFGATFKYLRQTSELNIAPGSNSDEGGDVVPIFAESRGIGLDVGFLARIKAKDGRNRFSIGVAAQDVPTVVRWNSDDDDLETEEYAPYRYRAGCSFEPLPRLTIAFDLVGEQNVTFKEVHLGVEHWIFPVKHDVPISEKNLAIRGGIARQLSASERMTFAAGLGIRWAAWQLDYAYLLDNEGLGDTKNRFSISVRF